MTEWKIRELKQTEIEYLFDFRKLVERRNKTREYFAWEYIKGNVDTLIADYNGKIVGQYSAQKYEAFVNGEKVKASLSFDTGTHPDFRKQGIFHKLGKEFFEYQGKRKVHFSTGFPNENFWTNGQNKFGWNGICKIPLFIRNRRRLSIRESKRYNFEWIPDFDNDFDGFSEQFQDDIPIYLNRTRDYLNWRFCDKPSLKDVNYDYMKHKILDRSGEMVGYIVSKQYKNQLQLVDFLFPKNEEIYEAVLHTITCLAFFLLKDFVSLYVNPEHPFGNFIQRKAFNFKDTNRVYIVRANNDYLDKNVLFNKKNHYITMGDCDVI